MQDRETHDEQDEEEPALSGMAALMACAAREPPDRERVQADAVGADPDRQPKGLAAGKKQQRRKNCLAQGEPFGKPGRPGRLLILRRIPGIVADHRRVGGLGSGVIRLHCLALVRRPVERVRRAAGHACVPNLQ